MFCKTSPSHFTECSKKIVINLAGPSFQKGLVHQRILNQVPSTVLYIYCVFNQPQKLPHNSRTYKQSYANLNYVKYHARKWAGQSYQDHGFFLIYINMFNTNLLIMIMVKILNQFKSNFATKLIDQYLGRNSLIKYVSIIVGW